MGQPLLFSMSGRPVLSQNQGDIENNCEDGKSGNGEDYETFVDIFSAALENNDGNGNGRKMTLHICRNECKNYYGVTDANDGQFKEFCWKKGETYKPIYEGHDCECVESKKPKLPEGILEI